MTIERVAVTGGNGTIGSEVVRELADQGYHVTNVSREEWGERGEAVADEYRTADLLDAGETYGALAACDADAVVHMATIPHPISHPEHVVFESNAMTVYHVLEAATSLGSEAVVLPSSINVMGATYQDAPTDVRYLPFDEDHPLTPRDPYAIGKHATEVAGAGFGRRPDAPRIASLRFPWVTSSDRLRERFAEADRTVEGIRASKRTGRESLFAYLHVADAAAIARCCLEADFDGHEAFWAVASDTNAAVPSAELADEFYPDAERRSELAGTESLVSIEKARELLGWEPERSWRDL